MNGWSEWLSWYRLRQIGFSIADQGFSVGGMFLVNVALARAQTKEEYGAFVLSYSVFTFLAGLHSAAILEAYTVHGSGRYRESFEGYGRLFWRSNLLLGFFATVTLVLLWCLVNWTAPRFASMSVLGMAVSCGVLLTAAFVRRTFFMQRRPDVAAKFSFTFFLTCCVFLWFVVHFERLNGFTAFAIAGLAWLVAGAIFARQLPGRGAKEKPSQPLPNYWAEHWKYSRWVFVTALVFQFTTQGYYWLSAGFLSVKDAGELRAMYNLVTPVDQLFVAIAVLVLPMMSFRFASRRMAGLIPLWKVHCIGSFLVTGIFAAAVNLFGKRVMHTVYAGKFDDVAPLLGTLALLPVVMGIGNSVNLALKAIEKPQAVFYAYVASGAATFAIGLPLLLHFGLRGAVYGMLASAFVYSVAQGIAFWWFETREYSMPLAASVRRNPLL